jgi:hypothetical protein
MSESCPRRWASLIKSQARQSLNVSLLVNADKYAIKGVSLAVFRAFFALTYSLMYNS